MRQEPAIRDAVVAGIAARQHGVLTARQLAAAGLDAAAIGRRVRSSRLHRVHRGVYAVGHLALSAEGRWMAAALACGDSAVLSHRAAAALWTLLPAAPGPIDVSVPGDGGRSRRRGIQIHRSASLLPAHATRRRGIPVTTPARTLADLHRVAPPEQLRNATRQAAVLGLEIGTGIEIEPTRSELEHRFLRLCGRHRLPLPEVNVRVGRFIVDFLWRDCLLIVETDGYRYHRGRLAFEEDRVRDLKLRKLGYSVVRFTYRQVSEDGASVAASVRDLLSDRVAHSSR